MTINPKSFFATLEIKQLSTNVALPRPNTERAPNVESLSSKRHFSKLRLPPTFDITANVTELPTKEQLKNDMDIDETSVVIPELGVSESVGKSALPS